MGESKPNFINHRPFGKHHPYEQDADERFPREPIAGEPVRLGVKTSPGTAIESVWADWRIEGSTVDHRVPGKLVEKSEEFNLWQVDLEPFEGGSKISYCLFARGANVQEQTPWFDFEVNTWVDFDRLVDAEQVSDEIHFVLASRASSAQVSAVVKNQQNGTFTLEIKQMQKHAESVSPVRQFSLDDLTVELKDSPFKLNISRKSKKFALTSEGNLRGLLRADGQIDRYEFAFQSPQSEAFYGFGERYNSLDQRGSTLMNRVIDQYKHQDRRTYYSVPFFVSSLGYGVWLDTDREVLFDMAETRKNCWKINSETGPDASNLLIYFLPQGTPASVMGEFTRLTGRSKMPPSWVFGLWMSSNDWNSQAEVLKQYELTRKYQIPATVLVIEAWSDEANFYIWNDARYELKAGGDHFTLADFTFPRGGKWPDPKAMTDTLHAGGTRLILWQNPTLKHCTPEEHLDERQNKLDESYWVENKLCVMEADGITPYRVRPTWFRNGLVADFTNPKTIDWWFKQREYLVTEVGVDGFKTDGGEHLWTKTAIFSDGTTARGRATSFPLLYISAYDEFLQRTRGKDSFLFSRAGFTGVQKHPGHWAGDEDSSWRAFKTNLFAMLSMSISGEPFVGWDLAGFGGELPDAELYMRAAAFSVFCPIMQYHSEYARLPISRDRTPWNIQEQSGDPNVIAEFRDLVNLRMNLLPYLQQQAWLSVQTGLPMMRALPLEYPQDDRAKAYPFEYFFGESLLVAPVVDEGKEEIEVYLPAGNWRDFWTQQAVEGGQTLTVKVTRNRVPVYQREGSMLVFNTDASFRLFSDVGNATETYQNLNVRIFPGQGCRFDLVRDQGDCVKTIDALPTGSAAGVEIKMPGVNVPVQITLFVQKPTSVLCENQPVDWQWDAAIQAVTIILPASQIDQTVQIL